MNSHLSVSSGLHLALLFLPRLFGAPLFIFKYNGKMLGEAPQYIHRQWFLEDSPEPILYPSVSWLDKSLSSKYPLVM